jgi:hypothetical protein
MKSILLISFLVLIISSTNDPSLYEVMDYISSSVINYKIKVKNIRVWALEDYYRHELIPSVSLYLFEDIKMIENIAPEGNPNRPGDKHEKNI